MSVVRRCFGSGVPVVLLLCLLQAFLCVFLCNKYYQTNGPFYDSLSYHLTLARIVDMAHTEGIWRALRLSLHGSTVFLPMATGALMGPFVGLHRSLGVWVQFPWVIALVLSARHCLVTWLKMDKVVAGFVSLLFVSLHAVYFFNGGLCDFRMDLLLYLLYGCSMCWFLIALESARVRDWLLCGFFCSMACLSRATAPVYLSLAMMGVSALHLAFSGTKRMWALAKGLGVVAAAVVLLAGWFYWINFKPLHYYYVVWNPDANAHLRLSESIRHMRFALESVGWWVAAGALLIVGVATTAGIVQKARRVLVPSAPVEKVLQALAVGIVPVAFLVFRGAGLNPFVSMPGAFGAVLFLLACASGSLQAPVPVVRRMVVLLALVTAFVSAWQGVVRYGPSPGYACDIKAYSRLAECLEQDVRMHGGRKVVPGVVTIGAFTGSGLMSVMLFDVGFRFWSEMELTRDGIVFDMNPRVYVPSSPVEWKALPVEGENASIQYLAQQAQTAMTHLIVPDEKTLKHLEERLSFCYINTVSRRLQRAIIDGGAWERIGDDVRFSPEETYCVYANRGAMPVAGSPQAPLQLPQVPAMVE